MEKYLTVNWEVEDGYIGGRRPQVTKIPFEEFEEDADDKEIECIIDKWVLEDFTSYITFSLNDDIKDYVNIVRRHND